MANDFIYTSVSDLQKLIIGNASSQSLAVLSNVMAETMGMSMHNAVTAQHNAQMLNSATTTSTCARILSIIGGQVPLVPKAEDIVPNPDSINDPAHLSQSSLPPAPVEQIS